MNIVVHIEHSASSSQSKHEGESSFGLCDRLSRTRDNSQRQLPTDQDYAVSTREYQTDQSSLNSAPAAARSVFEQRRKQPQQQTPRMRRLTRSLHIRPMHSLKDLRDLCVSRQRSASHILDKLFILMALVPLELIARVRKGAESITGRRALTRLSPFVTTSGLPDTDPLH
jgi:hypothetical protein